MWAGWCCNIPSAGCRTGWTVARWSRGWGAGVMAVAALIPLPFLLEVVVAMLLGGIINPLYSLLIALTNDHLQKEEMPGASAGVIFLNGFGAIFGPLVGGLLIWWHLSD